MLKDPSNDMAWNSSLFYALEAAEEEEKNTWKKEGDKKEEEILKPAESDAKIRSGRG